MQFPIDRVRAETPGCAEVLHFDNAGSALPPQDVVDTVIAHVRREAEIGGYEAAAEAKARVSGVYDSIARLLGANPAQIGVVENATRAWDMAVYGYPFRPGDRVLTSRSEYASNVIALLQLQQRHGIEIVLIEDDEHGQISLDHLATELDRGAALVALTHIPTNGGLVNPAAEVGAACGARDVFYVLDACQSAGQVPLDVEDLGCDVLTATGRKFLRGPRGTGFLYASSRALDILEPPFLDLHAATWTGDTTFSIREDAKRFETWETNFAAKLGLGTAVEYAMELGVDTTWSRIHPLAAGLRSELATIDGVEVHDKGRVQCGIVTFTVKGIDAESIKTALGAHRINTSVSTPEYARFDQPHRGLPALVRASVHCYNTEEETDRFCSTLNEILGSSRFSGRLAL